MEKTFSSMSSLMLGQIGPRNSEVSPGFCALVKGIRRAASAVEQDEIIEKEIDLLRQKLAQPDVGQVNYIRDVIISRICQNVAV
ncbi:hypothetical protein HOLleu_20508 [Holothuria leucospilota]|uniref:Uncharacterized protein n=1 Tax=Holothuria leucospilota TaxID=206669 RepID=A0A9Q1H818_HOLLE|nr:hypothetical protein HOLleu_20508 [Holothuria leucospilota]